MGHFSPAPGSAGLRVQLEAEEARLLRDLLKEMRTLLAAGDVKDPAIARLFPPAYDDGQEAAAFRDLVAGELQSGKVQAIDAVERALGRKGAVDVTLSESDADAWIRILTDLRLALGTRLEVTEETMDRELDPKDPDASSLSILHWLGWMQELTLEVMAKGGS